MSMNTYTDEHINVNNNSYVVGASSATITMEAENHIIYKGSNYHAKLPMASTTKVLTAYIACISGRLDDIITIPAAACGIEGSSIYLRVGEKISLRDLTYGLMLRSGNDSAEAIAIAISGTTSKFAELMNSTAISLGAKNSNFINPHGLHDDNHYTTAYDLALITANALQNEDFRKICATKMHVVKSANEPDRYLANKNKMLNMYEGAIGVKTGYTKAAGRCLVSAAERNGITLVTVVLNVPDMWQQSMDMLTSGFNNLRKVDLIKANECIINVRVKSGSDIVPIAIRDSYSYIGLACDKLDLRYEVEVNKLQRFPIKSNENLGKFRLFDCNRLIFETNIYSMIDIEGKGEYSLDLIENLVNDGSIIKNK